MVFYWSPSDNKSPQVFNTLLSILANFNNAAFWTVSACALIQTPLAPLPGLWGSIPSATNTTGITVTFMFHSFLFLWQGTSTYLSFPFLWFSFCSIPGQQSLLFERFSFLFIVTNKTDSGFLHNPHGSPFPPSRNYFFLDEFGYYLINRLISFST